MTVHQSLDHPNIVHYITSKMTAEAVYIFLELAHGGELFDRIGVAAALALAAEPQQSRSRASTRTWRTSSSASSLPPWRVACCRHSMPNQCHSGVLPRTGNQPPGHQA